MERIPVFKPYIDVGTLKHLTDAFHVGWLGMGATTKEFEERIADYLELDGRYVVATNTGTSALHIALLSAGVGPGDEVITPSFNYVADHQAIRMTGAEVVMCDIRDDNLGIDCEKARLLVSKRTKAIIPLHFAGIPCDINGVYDLAEEYGLRVIEDSMHAFGTTVGGRKLGSFGDMTCFSFDPVKIITSIDGGCIVVNSQEEAERLQRFRILGVDKDTTERYKNQRAWDYDVVDQGFRYHLTNIMASVGISQLGRVEEFIESRQRVCVIYNKAFSAIDGIRVPCADFAHVSPFIYSLRVLDGKRGSLIDCLRKHGVDAGIHFIPVHKHKFFSNAKCGGMEVTNHVVEEVVTLPLHSCMKQEFVRRIVHAVEKFASSLS
jgi:dTDP-4-amino-4,6-dideoxygalactose transaminase